MGYGKLWSEERVEEEIFKVIDVLDIDRMPSRSEVEFVTKNSALTNKIAKNGGFYHWAEKLGLETKNSDTKTGLQKEVEILEVIKEKLNLDVELTPLKFPYDILVNKCVKIDVKYSGGYDYEHGFYYSFNLEYKIPKCDILVLICGKEKIIVMPSHIMYGKKQVSIGVNSKYDKYTDEWELINSMYDGIYNSQSQ